jgi:hypothetical protein
MASAISDDLVGLNFNAQSDIAAATASSKDQNAEPGNLISSTPQQFDSLDSAQLLQLQSMVEQSLRQRGATASAMPMPQKLAGDVDEVIGDQHPSAFDDLLLVAKSKGYAATVCNI